MYAYCLGGRWRANPEHKSPVILFRNYCMGSIAVESPVHQIRAPGRFQARKHCSQKAVEFPDEFLDINTTQCFSCDKVCTHARVQFSAH